VATAITIVDGALQALGVSNELNPDDPYLQEQFFNALVRLLNRWAAANIGLGITIPTASADELGNPASTDDCLMLSLAVAAAQIAKVTPSVSLRKNQKIFYRQMKAAFGLTPEQAFPSSLPLGQGNNGGPRAKRFFPEPDQVGSDDNTAIGA
jgi:hypothetical protein